MIGSTNATIIIGGGSSATKIRTAEMPGVTITLSQNGTDIESKSTPATTGGIVDFEVSAIGTYTLTASGTNITTWTHNVEVTELNITVECKAGTLANYTFSQIHTASQGGYAHLMWSIQDTWTYVSAGSILNNHKFFITQFIENNGKDEIKWCDCSMTNNGYSINIYMSYITSSSAGSWTTSGTNYGGMKYSNLEQSFKEQNEEVYSQAQGILPDDYSGTLTNGVKFSDLKYTDTGLTCSVYDYNSNTDTMTLLSSPLLAAPSDTHAMFIKGYFKNVGAIDETTFNNGTYYTYSSYVYTKAITYASGTTYYGLYEYIQEDGSILNALSSIKQYLKKETRYASTGGSQSTIVSSFSDYCNIPAVEEIIGMNKNSILPDGSSATTKGAYNLPNEGIKQPGFDYIHQLSAGNYWTRSSSYGGYLAFISFYNGQYPSTSLNNNRVHIGNYLKICFTSI